MQNIQKYLLILLLAGFINPANSQEASYIFDPQASYIHIYTGAEGWLRSLSHEHQIAARGFEGEIFWSGLESKAVFTLNPNDFLVDDDYERSISIDPDFRDSVAGFIQSGTRSNMLGSSVLEADIYKEIIIEITPVSFDSNSAVVDIGLTFKRKLFNTRQTIQLYADEDKLSVEADFELDHADLGLKPFSIPGGLSRVAESLRFHVVIEASRLPIAE